MNVFRTFIVAICLLLAAQSLAIAVAPRREAVGVGSLPPGEFAGTLLLGGFRGLACDLLWIRAVEAKESHRTYESIALCEAITRVQPRFIDVWQHLAHDLAYNIAYEADGEDGRFAWFIAGVQANARGVERNPGVERLIRHLAWMFQNRGDMFQSRIEAMDWAPLVNPLLAEVRRRCPELPESIALPQGGKVGNFAIAHRLYVASVALGEAAFRDGHRGLPSFVRRLVAITLESDGNQLRNRGEHLAGIRRLVDAGEAWAVIAAWIATPADNDIEVNSRAATREVYDRLESRIRRNSAMLAVLLAPDAATGEACAQAILDRNWAGARSMLGRPGWRSSIGLSDRIQWLDQP